MVDSPRFQGYKSAYRGQSRIRGMYGTPNKKPDHWPFKVAVSLVRLRRPGGLVTSAVGTGDQGDCVAGVQGPAPVAEGIRVQRLPLVGVQGQNAPVAGTAKLPAAGSVLPVWGRIGVPVGSGVNGDTPERPAASFMYVLCQDCSTVYLISEARYEETGGEELCECGGDLCGCASCIPPEQQFGRRGNQ